MAAGRPVIALGQGGALETVVPPGGPEPPTGLLFLRQTVDDLAEAVRRFESGVTVFDPKALRRHAERFDRPNFKQSTEKLFLQIAQANQVDLPILIRLPFTPPIAGRKEP